MAEWLNYHHLFYFWTVVREGSVTAGSRKLRLAQPTVSGQLKELEEKLGVLLFHRRGGRLALTDTGAHVYGYADEIFTLGRELQDSLAGRAVSRGRRLAVGITDAMPKLIAQRLLEPALRADADLRLTCTEDRHERLLAELSLHELDVVLTDTPLGRESNVRGHSHLLGESAVSLFARPRDATRLRRGFPRSLDGVSLLLPIEPTGLRRAVTRWLDSRGVRARVRAEFQDSALLTVFGQVGEGVFAAPTVIAAQLRAQHHVAVVANLPAVRERFYAITVERRITHPAVRALTERARVELFAT
jgi:LysR family transcriptional activator of nhaA